MFSNKSVVSLHNFGPVNFLLFQLKCIVREIKTLTNDKIIFYLIFLHVTLFLKGFNDFALVIIIDWGLNTLMNIIILSSANLQVQSALQNKVRI